jgi:hypothetical protein
MNVVEVCGKQRGIATRICKIFVAAFDAVIDVFSAML